MKLSIFDLEGVLVEAKCRSFNYFWHQKDTLTLTSHKHIWAYPGKQPITNNTAVCLKYVMIALISVLEYAATT